jgi:hypothetical protein
MTAILLTLNVCNVFNAMDEFSAEIKPDQIRTINRIEEKIS